MTMIDDTALSARLCSPSAPEMMDRLEAIIVSDWTVYQRLQPGPLEFGRWVGRSEVESVFEQVKTEVAVFLGVPPRGDLTVVLEPRLPLRALFRVAYATSTASGLYGLSTGATGAGMLLIGAGAGLGLFAEAQQAFVRPNATYDVRTRAIRVEQRERLAVFRNTLIHEYDHHLLVTACGLNVEACGAFIEGHAVGVTQVLSRRRYAAGDPAPLYENLCRRLAHLLHAYRWLGARLGRPVRPDLARATVRSPMGQEAGRLVRRLFDPPAVRLREDLSRHGLGTVTLALAEAEHGEAVYRRAVHGDYGFLA